MSGVTALLLEYALHAVQIAGLPALFIIFLLKGALVGKLLPTSVVLPGYVFVSGPTWADAVILVLLLTVAHLLGQLAIVAGVRRYGVQTLATIPFSSVDLESSTLERIDRGFDQYGDLAVLTTNLVPWLRGFIAIPAGLTSYSYTKFTCYVGATTLCYHAVYVALAITGVSLLL